MCHTIARLCIPGFVFPSTRSVCDENVRSKDKEWKRMAYAILRLGLQQQNPVAY